MSIETVELNGQIITGDPKTREITAYQRMFHDILMYGERGRIEFVLDNHVSLEQLNSDPVVQRKFIDALLNKERERYREAQYLETSAKIKAQLPKGSPQIPLRLR